MLTFAPNNFLQCIQLNRKFELESYYITHLSNSTTKIYKIIWSNYKVQVTERKLMKYTECDKYKQILMVSPYPF